MISWGEELDVEPFPPVVLVVNKPDSEKKIKTIFQNHETVNGLKSITLSHYFLPDGVYVAGESYGAPMIIVADNFFKASDYARSMGFNSNEWHFVENAGYLGIQVYSQLK